MAYKIFLVEDDKVISGTVKSHLTMWGFDVRAAEDFGKVLEEFLAFDPQLVLLDISLPHYNGYHWCGEIRKRSKVPVVFLSSASDNLNIVTAMNLGGDDFIPKPFDLSVLTAKVQAILRRTYSFQGNVNLIEHKGAALNLSDASLSFEGRKIDLTKNDFKLLQILMENTGHVVSRSDMMNRLWESDSFIDDNTLTVNMTRLRRKLEENGLKGFVVTKKGLGYLVP